MKLHRKSSEEVATRTASVTPIAAARKNQITSASQLYRAGIMVGMGEDEIIELVNSRFPGRGKREHVKWYWHELKRKRINPPKPEGME